MKQFFDLNYEIFQQLYFSFLCSLKKSIPFNNQGNLLSSSLFCQRQKPLLS
ncbi:hypothetical protein LEP1GSC059_0405 [Leptospira noguchii serovar Panama str. CZ214]|uniref:Uncharacterized protein n=1 Tax=Leptospira noguchii serovar Panama str. CZ214 TaxID=1001595 RepID=T0FV46_9LEPT|nr:hypothetical protein LEP1GSC059_0405 [Leptospira noguchii serovar Panama str. CZ214]